METNRDSWVDNFVLGLAGIYLFLTPWLFSFTGHQAAEWDAWVGGAALAVLAFLASIMSARKSRGAVLTAEFLDVCFVAGSVWLFVAPWALRFSGLSHAAWNLWGVAVGLAVVSLYSMYDVYEHMLPHPQGV